MDADQINEEPDPRERLRGICRELLGPAPADAFVARVEQVLRHIATDREIEHVAEPEDVVELFRSRGLIPPGLRSYIEYAPNPDATAVCFAACIYPNRAYTLKNQLVRRLGSFLAAFHARVGILELLSANQLQGLSQREVDQLLSDLSAAEHVPVSDPEQKAQEAAERKAGAALYLATYDREEVQIIIRNWRDDAGVVRYIRELLPHPPSQVVPDAETAGGYTHWDKSDHGLAQRDHAEDPPERQRVIALEKKARWQARSILGTDCPMSAISQKVVACWETCWDKLICGFPYFAFRSHFVYWWRRFVENCLIGEVRRGRRERQIVVEPEGVEGGTVPPPPAGARGSDERCLLSIDELRVFREGYRLVRSTFFDHRGTPERTALLRRVADDLWYRRLERKMTEEQEREAVNQIAERHRAHQITKATVNNLSHRLRLRIGAYTLSRLMGFDNQRILTAELPAQKGASDRPFSDKANLSGVLTVATVARLAPMEDTLLWPFIAHRILRPRVEPQHPDPWTFETFMPELWCWVTAEGFRPTVTYCKDAGRVNQAAAELLDAEPVSSLLTALLGLESEEDILAYAEADGAGCVSEAAEFAISRCLGLTGTQGFEPRCEDCLSRWRKVTAGCKHLVVPVWYLAFAEQLERGPALELLQPTPDNQDKAADLFGDMQQCAECTQPQEALEP